MGRFIFSHKEGKTEMCFRFTVADGLIEEIGLRVDGTEPSVTHCETWKVLWRCCEFISANAVWLLLRITCQVRGRTDDSTSRWKKNARQSVLSWVFLSEAACFEISPVHFVPPGFLHVSWITLSCTDQSDCFPMSLLQCKGCAYVPSFISVKI